MSSAISSSKASTKLGEDQTTDNVPKPSSDIVYIKVLLHGLDPQFVQIPIARFLSEDTDQSADFISDHDARIMVRSAINEVVGDILTADTSGVYDNPVKDAINDYLEMAIHGTDHLRGMYYEIRSQAEPLQVSLGYRSVANTLVTRAVGNDTTTFFHFDFTKAVSHPKDRELFELYRGTAKREDESSLSTPIHTYGGSPSVLSDLESVMIADDADSKGFRVLSSLEKKLDSALQATKLSFLGTSKMPTNIDVVVEDVNEDVVSSDDSVNSKLPPIEKPKNQRRFGSLFPHAVAQAQQVLAGAAGGMASAFSKGPPPCLFSKGTAVDTAVNYGQKIRSMHSLSDPNTPTDSSNFATRRESHQKA